EQRPRRAAVAIRSAPPRGRSATAYLMTPRFAAIVAVPGTSRMCANIGVEKSPAPKALAIMCRWWRIIATPAESSRFCSSESIGDCEVGHRLAVMVWRMQRTDACSHPFHQEEGYDGGVEVRRDWMACADRLAYAHGSHCAGGAILGHGARRRVDSRV